MTDNLDNLRSVSAAWKEAKRAQRTTPNYWQPVTSDQARDGFVRMAKAMQDAHSTIYVDRRSRFQKFMDWIMPV